LSSRTPGRNPTRADVALRAQTSPATVSYVVNNGPKFVSDETRQRVLRAIEELGYQPDPVALSFRGSDSNAIGMLVPNFNGPFFSDLVAEVERQASRRGKVVLVGSTGYHPSAERDMLQTFRNRRVQAVLVIGPTSHVGTSLSTSSVVHGAVNVLRFDTTRDVVPVGIAQRAAAREAARHLLGHGRRRVAAVFGPVAHDVFNIRYRGWRDATAYTAAQTKDLVRRAEYSFQGGFDATMDLFTQSILPDALFVSNDTQAIGALSALHRLGLTVPDDVAVVSIDATELSPFLIPPLTSVRQPTDLIAEAALDIVDSPEHSLPKDVRVPFSLELRESCGCPPPAATTPRADD